MNTPKAEMKNRLSKALELREKKAADLVRDLGIPKSAISQYLSGKSLNMSAKRLNAICRYLDINEPWLIGYDVPMERPAEQKKADELAMLIHQLRKNERVKNLSLSLCNLSPAQLSIIENMVNELLKLNLEQ